VASYRAAGEHTNDPPPLTAPTSCPACLGPARLKRANAYGDSSLYRCSMCATEFIDPQPSDERLNEIYSSSYYDPWAVDKDPTVEAMKRTTFAWILAQCSPPSGGRVLDIGCATGFLLQLALDQGLEAWGIDLNAYAIEQCRQLVPDTHVHCGFLADEPFAGISFDAIFMIDFIEHVRDPEKELRAVRERLSEGGAAVISTPRTDSTVHALTRRGWPQYREEHLTYFSLPGITTLLRRCGFDVVSGRPTRKTVTLNYAHRLMQAYHQPYASRIAHMIWKGLPFFREVTFPVRLGEMTVVARKTSG
jgi:2-polyprenyl-3-methyl-5-hydroxy-6-metoxy-1,4-benzoquinol methylase